MYEEEKKMEAITNHGRWLERRGIRVGRCYLLTMPDESRLYVVTVGICEAATMFPEATQIEYLGLAASVMA